MNLPYSIFISSVVKPGYIKVQPNCNGFIAVNKGTVTARINNVFPLLPPPGAGLSGESLQIGGNWGEVYNGEIYVDFDAGGTNSVFIIQKVYKCAPGTIFSQQQNPGL